MREKVVRKIRRRVGSGKTLWERGGYTMSFDASFEEVFANIKAAFGIRNHGTRADVYLFDVDGWRGSLQDMPSHNFVRLHEIVRY